MCVSWDFSLRDWITEGCTTIVGEDRAIMCKCNHLTNFAILVVMPNLHKVHGYSLVVTH